MERLFSHKWQKAHFSAAFDGSGHLALVLGAKSGPSARHNAAVMRHKSLQGRDIFIVGVVNLIDAKITMFIGRVFGNISGFQHIFLKGYFFNFNFINRRDIRFLYLNSRSGFFRRWSVWPGGWFRAFGIKHNHIVGNNFGDIALVASLIIPASGLQAAFQINLGALVQVLPANFSQFSPGDNIVKFNFFLAIARGVGPDEVGGNAK